MPTSSGDNSELAAPPTRWAGVALATAGFALAGLSFFVSPTDVVSYDSADAVRYQQASDRLHSLSGAAGSPDATPQQLRELRDAQAEFVDVSEKLATARSRGPWLTGLMRYGGVVLLSGGLIVVALSYQPGSDR